MEKKKRIVSKKEHEGASILESIGSGIIRVNESAEEYIRKNGLIPFEEAMRQYYNIADKAARNHGE